MPWRSQAPENGAEGASEAGALTLGTHREELQVVTQLRCRLS
jgi:hypothetical protein